MKKYYSIIAVVIVGLSMAMTMTSCSDDDSPSRLTYNFSLSTTKGDMPDSLYAEVQKELAPAISLLQARKFTTTQDEAIKEFNSEVNSSDITNLMVTLVTVSKAMGVTGFTITAHLMQGNNVVCSKTWDGTEEPSAKLSTYNIAISITQGNLPDAMYQQMVAEFKEPLTKLMSLKFFCSETTAKTVFTMVTSSELLSAYIEPKLQELKDQSVQGVTVTAYLMNNGNPVAYKTWQ